MSCVLADSLTLSSSNYGAESRPELNSNHFKSRYASYDSADRSPLHSSAVVVVAVTVTLVSVCRSSPPAIRAGPSPSRPAGECAAVECVTRGCHARCHPLRPRHRRRRTCPRRRDASSSSSGLADLADLIVVVLYRLSIDQAEAPSTACGRPADPWLRIPRLLAEYFFSFLRFSRKGFSGFLPSGFKKEGNTGIPRNSGGMYNLGSVPECPDCLDCGLCLRFLRRPPHRGVMKVQRSAGRPS